MEFRNEESMKSLYGIYQIVNLKNGMIYVGQTRNTFQKRYWLHQWKLRDGSHDNCFLQYDWNKYGEKAFVFEVVEVVDDVSKLNEKELCYIDDCRQTVLCYNISDGGDGKRGVPMSEHAKRIIGEKNRAHNLGKHASEETKAKMSATRKGRKRDKDVMEALRQSRIGCRHTQEAKEKMSAARINAYKSGRLKTVLTEDMVVMIKKMLMSGKTKAEISRELGVAYHNVKTVERGISWTHVYVDGWDEYKK